MALAQLAGVRRRGVVLCMLCGFTTTVLAGPEIAVDAVDLRSSHDTWHADVSAPGDTATLLDFDIPAQPLAGALNLYATVSNRPALFPSDMVVGLTSSAVHGRYSSEAALRLLLQGTGLLVQKLDSGMGETFMLKAEDKKAAVPRYAGMDGLFGKEGYPGLVQTRIWQALCADSRTRPGHYSSLFRFRLDMAGRIDDARLLGSSGDAGRDAVLLQILRHLQIGVPPPPVVAQQSLTMMVLPDDAQTRPQCAQETP